MDEFLDSKVRVHDKHRLEIKLDVAFQAEERHVYRVETYLFIPRTLGVTPANFSKTDFYNNIQRYIRFKTPRFNIAKLRDASSKNSPLVRLKAMVGAISVGDTSPATVDRAYDEIKLLGCVVRAGLRDQVQFFTAELARIPEAESETAVRTNIFKEEALGFLKDILGFIEEVHGLRSALAKPAVPERLREAFAFMDEYFSIGSEDTLTSLLGEIRARSALRSALSEIDAQLAEIIKGQEGYRAAMGYPSLVDKGTDSETLVYRRGVLKKFISNVLYLQIETSEWEEVSQLLFATAAGLAMAFFMGLIYFANKRYAQNSVPFGIAAVVLYIGKDRIKELLRIWFIKHWTRWFSDRSTEIRDPSTGHIIGRMREAFGFVRAGAVPREILRRRLMDNITAIENEGKPEDIIRYEKEVLLFPKEITEFHERRKDLNDILRLNISPFLVQADDPKADYTHLNPKTGKLEVLECSRVYHLNVLLRYLVRTSTGETEKFDRIRIVLNRKGIKRLEEVASP
jgi:hypothetical protein